MQVHVLQKPSLVQVLGTIEQAVCFDLNACEAEKIARKASEEVKMMLRKAMRLLTVDDPDDFIDVSFRATWTHLYDVLSRVAKLSPKTCRELADRIARFVPPVLEAESQQDFHQIWHKESTEIFDSMQIAAEDQSIIERQMFHFWQCTVTQDTQEYTRKFTHAFTF